MYGGYIVKNNKNPKYTFGFHSNGHININELSSIPEYDQTRLVLPSIGCPKDKIVFESSIDEVEYNVNYIGYDGWVKVDSTLKTNSPIHSYKKEQQGYLQYGKPIEKKYNNEDFPVIQLKGRIYARYFEEYKMTFILYVMTPNKNTIELCDKEILSKSRIKDR